MGKLIIIALVILVIYLYYRQNNPIQPKEGTELQAQKAQANHYQKLYQTRVAKDLGQQEYAGMLNQKITDLESALLNLAKQKIKGKKAAEELVKELETNWQQDKENWAQQQKKWQQEQQILQKSILSTSDREHQAQLRKINLLFDDKAQDYEVIDFNGLYKLLEEVKAERERSPEP